MSLLDRLAGKQRKVSEKKIGKRGKEKETVETKKKEDVNPTVPKVTVIPLPAVFKKSPYDSIPDQGEGFETMAKRCAMGDEEAMFWMFYEFESRLTEAYRSLEKAYVRQPGEENLKELKDYLGKHGDDCFSLQASHMWLNRSALYGSEKAKTLLEEYPFYRQAAYFDTCFQQPGQSRRRGCSGAVMKKMGFLDFEENVFYDLESLNDQRIYVGSYYVSYDGPDETGFGMENEYDYYYFDEFFRLLYILRGWSRLDIRSNQGRIQPMCEAKKAEKQKEREAFRNRTAGKNIS